MKTRSSARSTGSQQPVIAPTPRQRPRPLGPLANIFSKPSGDPENDPHFRGTPIGRPNAFLMTAGG